MNAFAVCRARGKLKMEPLALEVNFSLIHRVSRSIATNADQRKWRLTKSTLKNTRNQNTYWTWSFRYGVVWWPLQNHHLDQVRTWNGFQKWHFRASKFLNFWGNLPPRPPWRLDFGARFACLPTHILTTAMALVCSASLVTPENLRRMWGIPKPNCCWFWKWKGMTIAKRDLWPPSINPFPFPPWTVREQLLRNSLCIWLARSPLGLGLLVWFQRSPVNTVDPVHFLVPNSKSFLLCSHPCVCGTQRPEVEVKWRNIWRRACFFFSKKCLYLPSLRSRPDD